MNINFSRKSDYESIYLHLQECNEDFSPHLNERVKLSYFAEKITNNAITFCAKDSHKLVGLISCYYNNGSYGFINHVSVHSKYKGLGIAKTLMNMCIDYAIENFYSIIILKVFSENEAAIKLYTKLGFKIIDDNSDYIVMIRVIDFE